MGVLVTKLATGTIAEFEEVRQDSASLLRELLDERKCTQVDLSADLKVDQSVVSRILSKNTKVKRCLPKRVLYELAAKEKERLDKKATVDK